MLELQPSHKHHLWKAFFATMATVSVVATVSPTVTGLVTNLALGQRIHAVAETTTSTPPELKIKPVSVRPVVSAFVTTPQECPPPPMDAPEKPARACDFDQTAVYELRPEALRVELTGVSSLRNPLTGVEIVQMSLTKESARQFEDFSAAEVGHQIAFVRQGTVVWSPKISDRTDGEILQLSGDMTSEQADEVARMLRDGT